MKWALAGISSGYYPHLQTLEQHWNTDCAQLACDTLDVYHPSIVEMLSATALDPLTPTRIEQFTRSLNGKAHAEGCEFIFCYYVGHMLMNSGQHLALLQGGATDGEIEKALSAGEWSRGERGDAFLPLAQLYDLLGSGGVPFCLLVDGCMESKIVQTRIASGGFYYDPMHPGTMTYTGPKDIITGQDLDTITQTQFDFGRTEPFLRGNNPVAFAAKPGTFAVARENPFIVGGPPVAPLAEQIYLQVNLFILRDGMAPPLKTLLDRIVGYRGVGEIGMEGGISWSDYTKLDAITSRLSPNGYVSNTDIMRSVVQKISLNLGAIEDFSRDPASGLWTLQIKTVEPSGRNRWDIWQLPNSSLTPKRILVDIVFPKIACSDGALYVYSDQTNQLFRYPIGAVTRTKIGDTLTASELAPSFDGKSILALEADNVVDAGGDTLWRVKGKVSKAVVKNELTQARCVVEIASGKFAWLTTAATGVIQFADDSTALRNVHVCDEELSGLAQCAKGLVAINQQRTRLYCLGANGATEAAWLLDTEDHPVIHYDLGYGGLHTFGSEIWFASDQSLLQIDLNQLDWQNYQPTDK